MTATKREEFVHARPADAGRLHTDVFRRFGTSERFLKALRVVDVEALVEGGSLWFVQANDAVVATAYVRVPETDATECDPAEFGGVYIVPSHRGRGLALRLSTLTLGAYLLDNEDPSVVAPVPLVAHVHVQNPDPRRLLARLGFECERQVEVPAGIEGFQAMPTNDAGVIVGDEFELTRRGKASALRELRRLARNGTSRVLGRYDRDDLDALAELYDPPSP